MFVFFRKRRIKEYIEKASVYVYQKYAVPVKPTETKSVTTTDALKPESSGVKYSLKRARPSDSCDNLYSFNGDSGTVISPNEKSEPNPPSRDVVYSLEDDTPEDHYDASEVSHVLRNYRTVGNHIEILRELDLNADQTFVDRLLYYINAKGVRDSKVYKAAQVDKRLFSKIVSNREYKPSKDTAIALALALELSLGEANDLLSRAGYTFSHSNKRDIIIEFFFREKVYNLIDVNEVLFSLDQKLIGRF